MLFSSSPRVHLLLSSAGSVTIRSLLRVAGRSRSLRRNPFTQLLIDFSCFLVEEILQLLIASSAAQAHGRVFLFLRDPLGKGHCPIFDLSSLGRLLPAGCRPFTQLSSCILVPRLRRNGQNAFVLFSIFGLWFYQP